MQWLLSTAINGVKSNQRKKWDGRKEISSKERPETLKKMVKKFQISTIFSEPGKIAFLAT